MDKNLRIRWRALKKKSGKMATRPGFHPEFVISQYPNIVQSAMHRIAKDFYATRSFHPIQVGNATYWAMLVRPTDEFSIYINTDREVLVVFATYQTFEIRTLEAYEEFYDLLESKRTDRSLRFLVSADSRIESIIKHYLDQNPEYPIIIPATFEELTKKEGNPLLDAVRRNYLLRDLFGYQNPLREETFFFGRQDVVNSVLDMARSGQNSSLFGLRKSGKTSAIYAIQRKAKAFSCNVTVIDCQNPAVHARRYDALLSHVVMEIRKTLGIKKISPELGDSIPDISENFFLQMNNVLSSAKNNILIIFDEIENISPKTAASTHWREGEDSVLFWQILRSYIQSESKGRLSICLVGTSPHVLELAKINDIDNPIYLYAPKKFIPNLTFDETRYMVERLGYFMGLEFSVAVIAELQREFGGHPFFTRQICSKIHQLASPHRPLEVSVAALQKAKTEFYGQLEGYLRDIINQLERSYPEEFEILKSVVSGSSDELSEFGRDAPDLIDHLIGYGLVSRVGNDFDIKFDVIKNILQRMISDGSEEDRWAEISRRRNSLETNIRITLYIWSKSIGSQEWREIVERSLTKKRLEGLPALEPGVLFSSKDSPLYLSDLLMFMKESAVLPYLGDRRSHIVSLLHTVNKHRKDAHALAVTDQDMAEARAAFDYLEAEFSTP